LTNQTEHLRSRVRGQRRCVLCSSQRVLGSQKIRESIWRRLPRSLPNT